MKSCCLPDLQWPKVKKAAQSDFAAGWNRALRLLGQREHSIQEITGKLRQAGLDNATVEMVVERLLQEQWLDESRYAESFVRSQVNKGYGPFRIRQTLQQRGIAEHDIVAALEPYEADWLESALMVRQKKFGNQPATSAKERAKQQRFLLYRGFTHEQIRMVLDSSEIETGSD